MLKVPLSVIPKVERVLIPPEYTTCLVCGWEVEEVCHDEACAGCDTGVVGHIEHHEYQGPGPTVVMRPVNRAARRRVLMELRRNIERGLRAQMKGKVKPWPPTRTTSPDSTPTTDSDSTPESTASDPSS